MQLVQESQWLLSFRHASSSLPAWPFRLQRRAHAAPRAPYVSAAGAGVTVAARSSPRFLLRFQLAFPLLAAPPAPRACCAAACNISFRLVQDSLSALNVPNPASSILAFSRPSALCCLLFAMHQRRLAPPITHNFSVQRRLHVWQGTCKLLRRPWTSLQSMLPIGCPHAMPSKHAPEPIFTYALCTCTLRFGFLSHTRICHVPPQGSRTARAPQLWVRHPPPPRCCRRRRRTRCWSAWG